MIAVAVLIGIVAAGVVDAATYAARRRRSGSMLVVTTALAVGLGFLGLLIARSVAGKNDDVYYLIGFVPTLLAGDFLTAKVIALLDRARAR